MMVGRRVGNVQAQHVGAGLQLGQRHQLGVAVGGHGGSLSWASTVQPKPLSRRANARAMCP